MEATIRIIKVELDNIKNVRKGKFNTLTTFERLNKADVVGFYGQNGSGKTAVVDAFSLFKDILMEHKLPDIGKHFIHNKSESAELKIEFAIKNGHGEFTLLYEVKVKNGKENVQIDSEKLSYRENEKNKRYKELASKTGEKFSVRNLKSQDDLWLDAVLANKLSQRESTTFIFHADLLSVLEKSFSDIELQLLNNLKKFNFNFHVIDNVKNGLLMSHIVMPFNVHLQDTRGHLPYNLKENSVAVLPEELYPTIERVLDQINIVLRTIVPGLEISSRKLNVETLDDGEEGVRFELLSRKGGIELPLRCESAGILKLISILSTLIAVYNREDACVVIDELDAGIYEFLLGELLEVISEHGKGQLFFTSHNLRILEVLPVKNLWFTTENEEDRYLQLKGVKKLNNVRDIYLRAIQLGGQDESMYAETDTFDIKKAFRKAGKLNG